MRERTIQSEGVYADVRPLKVGHDQAQEGDRRRPAARRGKPFARLIKNIELGARTGGGDPAGNPTLYDAIQKAKRNSVPNENIDRAQKRGAGLEGDGADYQSLMFEGYGPSGVGILIECLTDNRNRAATEVRTALTRNGGSLAEPGAVSYLFARKGVVIVPKGKLSEDEVGAAVRDAGAEEVNDLGESFEVVSEPTDLTSVRTALQSADIDYESAESSFVSSVAIQLDEEGARKILKLIDALEDSDDVQNVYSNFDVPEDVMALINAVIGIGCARMHGRHCRRTRAVASRLVDVDPSNRSATLLC